RLLRGGPQQFGSDSFRIPGTLSKEQAGKEERGGDGEAPLRNEPAASQHRCLYFSPRSSASRL
ncbi:MAG TPA: hypothetical protein VFW62_04130, partial [bacterium]|nr:hypothetical protein [bacterium]